MKTETTGSITWFINSRGMLEKMLGDWNGITQAQSTIPSFRGGNGNSNGPLFSGAERSAPGTGFKEEPRATGAAIILVPFESSERSLKAARVGVSIAQHTGGQLVLCHALFPKVIPFGPATPAWVQDALAQEAVKKMDSVLELARAAKVTATCQIEQGTPASVILKLARRWEADLIVLTAERQRIWSRLLFGPRTAEQVIDRAECHVIVVRDE